MLFRKVPIPIVVITVSFAISIFSFLGNSFTVILNNQLASVGVTTTIITSKTVSNPTYLFSRTLKLGSTGTDVKQLQILLNQDPTTKIATTGFGSAGEETTYFGNLTKNAVIKLQNKYKSEILAPVQLTSGTGFFGPSTIKKINNIQLASSGSPVVVTFIATTDVAGVAVVQAPTQTAPSRGGGGGGGGGSSISTRSLTTNSTNGTVVRFPDQTNYSSGTEVTLTATPTTGYFFSDWSSDLTGSTNPTTIIMSGDKTVEANFSLIDVVSPTVAITSPGNNTVALGTVNILATASDEVGVTKVEFYKESVFFMSVSEAPYSISWNTTLETNGFYSWVAKAYDSAGNVGDSVLVRFLSNNPSPTVTFSVASTSVSYNGTSTLSWVSEGADTCTASGDWSGDQTLSGVQDINNLTISKSYTLTCTNLYGGTAKTVTVDVDPLIQSNLASTIKSQFSVMLSGKTAPSFSGNPPYAQSITNIFNIDGSRNTQIWTGDVDLTCIPKSIGHNGVLITKRDMIFADHWAVTNPVFADNIGNDVSRTIVASRLISNSVGDVDIRVATLDSDVPDGVTPCVLAPSTIRTFSPAPSYPIFSTSRYPMVFTNQDRTLLIGEIGGFSTMVHVNQPTYSNLLEWYYSTRLHDSGAPAFLLVDGVLALLTNWHYVGAGPVDADNIEQINAAITANGSPYSVSTLDLSRFSTY
jgi:hypothetical protein